MNSKQKVIVKIKDELDQIERSIDTIMTLLNSIEVK